MTNSIDWKHATAPTLADFEQMTHAAWERLPSSFRQLAVDLVIRVEDFGADETLDELGIEDPYELTGLYQGVSLDQKSVSDIPREPDMVFLYRLPILDEWVSGEDELGHLIAHVLVHEIGHHFGFSDDDMEDVEAQASA